VTSEIYSTDILDKNEFWTNELLKVGKEFLYGCSTGQHADWLEPDRPTTRRQGIHEGHAYSIMDAVEHTVDGKTYRLVKIRYFHESVGSFFAKPILRNPWGNSGWSGPWSDGSAEWTPQWMERLKHRFGDDGVGSPRPRK
jgi:Calpain family cysteine protease